MVEHLPSISRPSTHPCARGNTFSLSFLSILTCRGQHGILSQVTQGSTHLCSPGTHHHPITTRGTTDKHFPGSLLKHKKRYHRRLTVLVRTYSACHDLTNQHSEGNHRNRHQTKSTGGLLAWRPDIS